MAERIHETTGQQIILFTARFNPARIPGATDTERLALVLEAQSSVFAITNRMEDALHSILDLIERRVA